MTIVDESRIPPTEGASSIDARRAISIASPDFVAFALLIHDRLKPFILRVMLLVTYSPSIVYRVFLLYATVDCWS
jgi:hypothetical protein